MPEMQLRQPGFTYSALDHLQKTKKESKNLKKQDSRYIYQNELDKACFQHDMAYGDFKDLTRIIAKKYLILLNIRNMMDINLDFLQWSIFF